MLNKYTYHYHDLTVHVKAINREDADIAFSRIVERVDKNTKLNWEKVEVIEDGKEHR